VPTTPTLLLFSRYTDDSQRLWQAATRRGWAVIEANAAWGAGLCGCDADRVRDVVLQQP